MRDAAASGVSGKLHQLCAKPARPNRVQTASAATTLLEHPAAQKRVAERRANLLNLLRAGIKPSGHHGRTLDEAGKGDVELMSKEGA